jgi:glycosyltransferase involved in cell wall biosynthesis
MKVSIVTVTLNNAEYTEDCIKSVISQDYKDIEYIIIDGGSRDGTIEIIKRYEDKIAKWISEPDQGIYDAMNKGIRMASGEVVGILNSDDMYYNPSVLKKVKTIMDNPTTDACYGDLIYVERNNINSVVRYWKSSQYENTLLKKGWILPHPTFFVRKNIYEKYGVFDLTYPLAADYELIVRFLSKFKIRAKYIPEIMIKMRSGGVTNKSLINICKQNMEILNALQKNKINISCLSFFFSKLMSRYRQYTSTIHS